MKKFNVDIDLGMSGFNFTVEAETLFDAMIAAVQHLHKHGIESDKVENLSIQPY